ncbi:sensor histidine kinase [Kitasatospora sp. CB01950]|uniref:sensor histidine kinase n=1 Tax=Kitasatospora sp. CB01950 TaxID=1703930 RepID=UPI000939C72E|nr:histidine kinase [Kitasatospora sp. CB01950]OKJ02979.1 histidine kinase [Kitasatospora sp. CB01950]
MGEEAIVEEAVSVPRRAVGGLLGVLTAPVAALYLVLVGAVLGPWPRARRAFHGGVARLAGLERARRAVWFGDRFPAHYRVGERELLRYLARRSGAGLVSGLVLGLIGFGGVLVVLLAAGALRGTLSVADLLGQVLLGGVLLFLAVQGLASLADLDARLARDCFGPSEAELLRHRIAELADSRAAVLHAVDAERRRIERDLHDGVQQRLVALRLLLGRARRGGDPQRTDDLLRQAHREAAEVLTELREVAWRVYPSALDTLGLDEALAGLAERCPIPLRVRHRASGALPGPVLTAAWFVVSECVTNAAKHSAAAAIEVAVDRDGARLTVRVEDDGRGGADPAGGGLSGLRGRVAALDGTLHVHSPAGGPTVVTAELPCG